MPMSPYLQNLRRKVGNDLLLLPSVTVIHFDAQGRMLLLKHSNTKQWVAPGGAIEPYETPANAAVREMWEETGLWVELTGILGVFGGPEFLVTYANGDKTSYVMIVFECEIIGGELNAGDGEALEFAYVSREDLANMDLSPWARVTLPKLFARKGRPYFKEAEWSPGKEG